MLKAFSRAVTGYPWFWVAAWLVVMGGLVYSAPDWSDVSSEGELEHLPPDSPSRQANRLFNEAFPAERSDSNIVIVLRRQAEPLELEDYLFMAQQLVPRLDEIAEQHGGVIQPSLLEQIEESLDGRSLTAEELRQTIQEQAERQAHEAQRVAEEREGGVVDSDGSTQPRIVTITAPHNSLIGPLLISNDQNAMIVLVPLTSSFLTSENKPILQQVEQSVEELRRHERLPAGLEMFVTGSAVLGRDVVAAVTESTDAIETWTVWLVLVLLLITFRAPVVALIPLVTLYVAVTISLNLLALLAGGGVIDLFDGLQIYATVLIYGAGVDYGMFLISRFREELSHGERVRQSLAIALSKVGFAIIISAGTEIVGIGVLSLADFGKFRQSGVAVPLGLAITLLASLTFTVALLRITGRWGFWPQGLAFRRSRTNLTGDRVDEETDVGFAYRFWRWVGMVIRAHPLLVWCLTMAVMAPFCLFALMNYNNVTYDMTSGLPSDAPSLQGNAQLQEHFSRGIIGPVTIMLQNKEIDFASNEGTAALVAMTQDLLRRDTQYEIADLQVLIRPAGTSPRAQALLDQVQKSLPGRWDRLMQSNLPVDASEEEKKEIIEDLEDVILQNVKDYYVSQVDEHRGHITRMTLILNGDPFSKESIVGIDEIRRQIRRSLPAELQSDTEIYMLGPTASLYDVRVTAERDRQFMLYYVTLAVLLILILLLRKLVISVYLVATVILTYLVTLGVTYMLFMAIGGDSFAGLQWTVPTLLFTLLMAVGADYNVLLVERFGEEQLRHGPGTAAVRSLAATGGLISGAGTVMAGTFLALNIGGTLDSMQQLGFALSFGVLIDTFLVRPLLVPTFLLLVVRARQRLFGKREGEAGEES